MESGLTSRLQNDGVVFRKKKWIRLPFTDTHKEVEGDKFVEALEKNPEKVNVQIGDGPRLPVRSSQDLKELAVFAGHLEADQLENPELGAGLKKAADLGYRISAGIGTETATSLYAAYNALTQDLGFEKTEVVTPEGASLPLRSAEEALELHAFLTGGELRKPALAADLEALQKRGYELKDGAYHAYRTLAEVDSGAVEMVEPLGHDFEISSATTLAEMARFYADPKNAEWAKIAGDGFTFHDSLGRPQPPPMLQKDGSVSNGKVELALRELPEKGQAEALQRLVKFQSKLGRDDALRLYRSRRDADSAEKFADRVREDLKLVSFARSDDFTQLAVEELQRFPRASEGVGWILSAAESCTQARSSLLELALENPTISAQEAAEEFVDNSKLRKTMAKPLVEALAGQTEYRKALSVAQELATEIPAEEVDSLLDQALRNRSAQQPEELAKLGEELLHSVSVEAAALLGAPLLKKGLLGSAQDTAKILDWASDCSNLKTRGLLFRAFGKRPSLDQAVALGADLSKFVDDDPEGLRVVAGHLLRELGERDETSTMAAFGERVLARVEQPEDVKATFDFVLKHAKSTDGFGELAAEGSADLARAVLTEVAVETGFQERADWVEKVLAPLRDESVPKVAAELLSELGKAELGKTLMGIDFRDLNDQESLHLKKSAFALLDPDTPVRRLAEVMEVGAKPADAARIYDALFERREASTQEELTTALRKLSQRLHTDESYAGVMEAGLRHLEPSPAVELALDLGRRFPDADTQRKIHQRLLNQPALQTGVELAKLGHLLVNDLKGTYRPSRDAQPVGEYVLQLMKDKPDSRVAAEFALATLPESCDPFMLLFWTFAHPEATTVQELVGFGKGAKAPDCRLLMRRFAPESTLVKWADHFGEGLSELAFRRLTQLVVADLERSPEELATVMADIGWDRDFTDKDWALWRAESLRLLATDPKVTEAANFGLGVVSGLKEEDSARVLEIVLKQRNAQGGRELAEVTSKFLSRVRGPGRAEAGRAAFALLKNDEETAPVGELVERLAEQFPQQESRNAIYTAFAELPADLNDGREYARLAASVVANCDDEDVEGLGRFFLDRMKADPRTRTSADFGCGVLDRLLGVSAGVKRDLLKLHFSEPEAVTGKELARLGAHSNSEVQVAFLEELEQRQDCREMAGWARELISKLSSSSRRSVLRQVEEVLEQRPAAVASDLLRVARGTNQNGQDRYHLYNEAFQLLRSTVPNAEFALRLTEGMSDEGVVRTLHRVQQDLEAATVEEFSELAGKIHAYLPKEDRRLAGPRLLRRLQEFPEGRETAAFGLGLLQRFEEESTLENIEKFFLKLPSPEKYPATAAEIIRQLRAGPESEELAGIFLEGDAAQRAERMRANLSADERQKLERWLLVNPKMESASELLERAESLDVASAPLAQALMKELERYPETARMAGWAATAFEGLSHSPLKRLLPEVLRHATEEPNCLEDTLEDISSRVGIAGSDQMALTQARLGLLDTTQARYALEVSPLLSETGRLTFLRAVSKNLEEPFAKMAYQAYAFGQNMPDKMVIGPRALEILAAEEPEFWELPLRLSVGKTEEQRHEIYSAFLRFPSFAEMGKADPRKLGPYAAEIVEMVQLAKTDMEQGGTIAFAEDAVQVGDFELELKA